MKPSITDHSQNELFRSRLSALINPKQPLKILGEKIDWDYFEREFQQYYKSKKVGQPPKPIRLLVGLLMLQHMFKESDEHVVKKWVENPYWQHFCGYDHLQWQAPINPSTLTSRMRKLGLHRKN